MKGELDFPRVIYRGPEDPLGQGNTETKKCESADDFKVDEKDGWRLERDPNHHAANAKKAKADEAADAADAKGKK